MAESSTSTNPVKMSLASLFSSIANALRAKTGTTAAIKAADFPTRIQALPVLDTSDANAAAGDILSGKTAYVKGTKVTGSIASKTASNLTASGATVTVPAGHYASQAEKSVATATQATPSISVDANGKITASATQTAGYVAAGTKSATQQLTTQAAQTITPGTTAKTIASGKYLTGTQTIKGDINLKAENIKSGVSIFGVAGTIKDVGLQFTQSYEYSNRAPYVMNLINYFNGSKTTAWFNGSMRFCWMKLSNGTELYLTPIDGTRLGTSAESTDGPFPIRNLIGTEYVDGDEDGFYWNFNPNGLDVTVVESLYVGQEI